MLRVSLFLYIITYLRICISICKFIGYIRVDPREKTIDQREGKERENHHQFFSSSSSSSIIVALSLCRLKLFIGLGSHRRCCSWGTTAAARSGSGGGGGGSSGGRGCGSRGLLGRGRRRRLLGDDGQRLEDGVHLLRHSHQDELELLFGGHHAGTLVAYVLQRSRDVDVLGALRHPVQHHVDQAVGARATCSITVDHGIGFVCSFFFFFFFYQMFRLKFVRSSNK